MAISKTICSLFLVLAIAFSSTYGEDKPLFMGLIIKDNVTTIDTFLNKIEGLEYDKSAIQLRLDIINHNPEIAKKVRLWCDSKRARYSSIECKINSLKPSAIKNSYLSENEGNEWIFITSSDVFLKSYALRWLTAKNLPVVAPMLRPLPKPNDPHRNFYLNATEYGYYKDHPDYYHVADRKKTGTFRADCVHSAYLISSNYAYKLNFEDGSAWDFISFSNTARNNKVPQFICNEREFGFFIHSDESVQDFPVQCLIRDVARSNIQKISSRHVQQDDPLKHYQESFPIENYSLYPVQEDLFWVDDKWEFVKSDYIKKGLEWEHHIQELFRQYVKEGDTVIDMGGHIGTHTIVLSRCVGPKGKVHVFEPQTKLFTELLVNITLNRCENVFPHRIALGSKEGVAYINHPNPINEGMAKISSSGEKVALKTLDSFNISNVSLIKIDIEGYEIEALKGALTTIQKNRPVLIIEVFKGPECAERLKFIKSLGYDITHLGGDDYLCVPTSTDQIQACSEKILLRTI
jgi:FkbM family methyltransferase